LSKHGYKVRAKFFLEFYYFEDNFNHCILPLFEELGQVNDSNKAELEAHAQQFWSSFKEWDLDFGKRMSLVKQFFQNVANNFHQNYNLIALKNNELELTSVNSIKPEDDKSMTEWHDSASNSLYIYDQYREKNGFLILDTQKKSRQTKRGQV
jgi:hypothetical protein